jgi:hypothetical protein
MFASGLEFFNEGFKFKGFGSNAIRNFSPVHISPRIIVLTQHVKHSKIGAVGQFESKPFGSPCSGAAAALQHYGL